MSAYYVVDILQLRERNGHLEKIHRKSILSFYPETVSIKLAAKASE
jgi:hypothetical protein